MITLYNSVINYIIIIKILIIFHADDEILGCGVLYKNILKKISNKCLILTNANKGAQNYIHSIILKIRNGQKLPTNLLVPKNYFSRIYQQ